MRIMIFKGEDNSRTECLPRRIEVDGWLASSSRRVSVDVREPRWETLRIGIFVYFIDYVQKWYKKYAYFLGASTMNQFALYTYIWEDNENSVRLWAWSHYNLLLENGSIFIAKHSGHQSCKWVLIFFCKKIIIMSKWEPDRQIRNGCTDKENYHFTSDHTQ